eukprot:1027752-Prymnesium_polylepis.1
MIAAEECDETLLSQMLSLGASPAAVCDKGRTALVHAAIADADGCIPLLLEARADAAAIDREGHTALMRAACS